VRVRRRHRPIQASGDIGKNVAGKHRSLRSARQINALQTVRGAAGQARGRTGPRQNRIGGCGEVRRVPHPAGSQNLTLASIIFLTRMMHMFTS
jgi:hypothetical protein